MEGGSGSLEEDNQRDEEPVVLWEKCIQQSIIVDLGEDESLHLSDLENSLAFHISQAESARSETSIHLSGCAEMSDYDSSSESIINSHSEGEEQNHTKSSVLCQSVQRPNTEVQDVPSQNLHYNDPGQNTSDEDQEDLLYDGDLGSHYFNQTADTLNQDGRQSNSESPDFHQHNEPTISNELSNEHLAPVECTMKAVECIKEHATNEQDIDSHRPNQVLENTSFNQSQFPSKDDLLRSGRLIEAETLPEVSLLESMDDTVFSRVSVHSDQPHPYHDLTSICETNNSSYSEQKSNNVNTSLIEAKNNYYNGTPSRPESVTLNSASDNSKQQNRSDSVSDETEEEELKDHRAPLLRTSSFNEIKYGQGQVHYPLPDFSKVAPKVRIPKMTKESSKPVQQAPSTIHSAHSSPEMLDVVSRVLEDSEGIPVRLSVFSGQDTPPLPAKMGHNTLQHLQAEYNKLLAKHAEAENLIDQMRLGTNPASELQLCFEDSLDYLPEESLVHPLARSICAPFEIMTDKMENKVQTNTTTTSNKDTVSSLKHEVEPSDGEIMTTELSNIVSQFMQNVEEFKVSVSNRSINLEEQQMMFRSLMETQDQLERKYMSKKEEHRALEMQNYMGICRNTGTFDPDRIVEGGIFKLGMFLEDIKEIIDMNLCETMSPLQSSSTPLPFIIQPNVLCMSTPSSLSLHQDQSTSVSSETHEEGKLDATEASAGHVNGPVEQSYPLVITDLSKKTETHKDNTRLSQTFQNGCLTPPAEDRQSQDQEIVLAEATGYSNILAYFRTTNDSPGESLSPSQSSQERQSQADSDLDHCLSLSVELSYSSEASKNSDKVPKPPVSSSVSQGRLNQETDSGFGSSYLNQSSSGSSQQNLNESFHSRHDPISSSESEGSCSNLQTTIEPTTLTRARWVQPSVYLEPPAAVNPVQQWLESTTKEALVTGQGTKQHHMSEPILSKMCIPSSPTFSCSCNNEAILALQSEVSRLKKDMKEGLIQLPYLTEKLDHLASKHEHATKTKSRTHQRTTINSPLKSPIIGLTANSTTSPVKLDWISTDIDPSKSKATDNEDTTASEMQFDFSPIEGRSGSHFVHLDSGLHPPGASLSSRAYERWSPLYSTPIQKPLLQVNYGSSSSLPASYKLREYPLQPAACSRKRSTQSDTALLPSDVFFQHTLSPLSAPSKLGGRIIGHGGSKEEDIHRTLDQAIEVARSMKKTTDRMAKSLSADLAKAKFHRKLYRGRKHHAL